VRLVPGGAFTTWLHAQAKVGQRLQGHGPYGDFWLRPGKAPILAIAVYYFGFRSAKRHDERERES